MSLKKQRLYEVAAQLFREKGYAATSMRDLAEQLQLQVSSLYSHINSKEEILQTICFDYAHQFLKGIENIEQMELSVTNQLRELIRLHIKIALHAPTTFSVFNDEWRSLSEPFYSDFLALRRDYEERFRAIIRKGISAGELKNLDANVLLYTLLAALHWLHRWYKPERGMAPDILAEQMETLLLSGIS